MISLLTMGSGNVKVLKDTLDSFKGIYDEVIYGDLLLFPEDRQILHSYKDEYKITIIPFPFNFLFKQGFSCLLNQLARASSHRYCMYMNTSEVIDENYNMLETIWENRDCNAFFFTHRTDPHRWFRIYNPKELQWSGIIHEQLEGEYKPYHKPVFMMADREKDLEDTLKAKILNDVKEIVYHTQYNTLVENPKLLASTDPGWVKFVTENYEYHKAKLIGKGNRYRAFIEGDLQMYFDDVKTSEEFKSEVFESNIGIEFQGDKKYLL
jgi:hypothetical protein